MCRIENRLTPLVAANLSIKQIGAISCSSLLGNNNF